MPSLPAINFVIIGLRNVVGVIRYLSHYILISWLNAFTLVVIGSRPMVVRSMIYQLLKNVHVCSHDIKINVCFGLSLKIVQP